MYEFRLLHQCVVGRLRTPGLPRPPVPPTRSNSSPRRRRLSSVVLRPASEQFVRAAVQVRREFGYLLLICAIGTGIGCVVRQRCGIELCDGVRHYWWSVIVLLGQYRWEFVAITSWKQHKACTTCWCVRQRVQHSDEPGKSLEKMKFLNFPVRNYLYKQRKYVEVCLV